MSFSIAALCTDVEGDGADLSDTRYNILNSINQLNQLASTIKSNLPRDSNTAAEVNLAFLVTNGPKEEGQREKVARLRGDIIDFQIIIGTIADNPDAIDGIVHNAVNQKDQLPKLCGYFNACNSLLEKVYACNPPLRFEDKLDSVKKASSEINGMTSVCLQDAILTQVQKFCKHMKVECESLPEKLPEDTQSS